MAPQPNWADLWYKTGSPDALRRLATSQEERIELLRKAESERNGAAQVQHRNDDQESATPSAAIRPQAAHYSARTELFRQQLMKEQREQAERGIAHDIAATVERLYSEEESTKVLRAIESQTDNVLSAATSAAALPPTRRETQEHLKSFSSALRDVKTKIDSLTMVAIEAHTRHQFDYLQDCLDIAQKLTGLQDAHAELQRWVSQHPIAELIDAHTVVARYVASGDEAGMGPTLHTALALLKESSKTAQMVVVAGAGRYKQEYVPSIVTCQRDIAKAILATCNSFWDGEPILAQVEAIERTLTLSGRLGELHDSMQNACQTVADFVSQHDQNHPVDIRKVPAPVIAALQTMTKVVAELTQNTMDPAQGPQVGCFSQALKYAGQYIAIGRETLQSYDSVPKSTLSRLAVAAFGFGIAAIFTTFLAGIPAIILGHKALKGIKWHRGKGLAIAALILGYLMTGVGVILVVASMR